VRLSVEIDSRYPEQETEPESVRNDRLRYVDFEQIERWLHNCRNGHNCRHLDTSSHLSALPEGFRLIDIEGRKLISGASAPRYAALSYVWGECKHLKLLIQNTVEWGRDGALQDGILSRVVQDAMLACKRLGIGYLWVDSLCICQDDDLDKKTQLGMMDVIYSAAYITLVDGRGTSADDVGLSRVSRPLSTDHVRLTVDGTKYYVIEEPASAINRSKWHSRGWTLQEAMLSRRLVAFTEKYCLLVCPRGMQAEPFHAHGHHPFPTQPGHETGIADLCGAVQKFSERPVWNREPTHYAISAYHGLFLRALNDYLTRNLTRDTDIGDAFLGITGMFKDLLGVFHWGLPIKVFARALLWTRKDPCYLKNGEQDQYKLKRRPEFPSWSWLGWIFGKSWSKEPIDNRDAWPHRNFCPLIHIWGIDSTQAINRLSGDEMESVGIEGYTPGFMKTDAMSSWPHSDQFQPIRDVPQASKFEQEVVPKAHLLVFWASCAVFKVSMHSSSWTNNHDLGAYDIECGEGSVNFILLEAESRRQMPEELEFIAIATTSDGGLHTIVIERKGDLIYRVGVPNSKIQTKHWIEARPERKLIVLA
jgi:hypothetical protein